MDTRKWFILTLVVTLAAVIVVIPVGKKPDFLKDIKITPGIDLAGGADLTYRILYKEGEKRDPKKRPEAVKDVLKKRINQRGLKEPRITTLDDDKIVIQIAVQSPQELRDYKNLLEQVGKLELKAVASKQIHEDWLNRPGTKEGKWELNAPAGYKAIPNSEKLSGEYDYLGHEFLLVTQDPVVTGDEVKNANPAQTIGEGRGGGWKIHFELSEEGGKKFDNAAKDLYKQSPKGLIAIIMDGVIKSKPRIQSEKFGGSGEITGSFSKAEADNLAVILRSGQLPVEIGNGKGEVGKPESENFIGPTLAQDSLRRGVAASIAAALLVTLFMLFYYRIGGVIAVFTLVCNITYLLAIMAIFGATMTLPGLAGLALTIGMAVDNNILILERIREEMAKGKTALQAFEAGHTRAFSAILDGNVTTLLAASVLYYFGTDAVQGFATVLAIGIFTTMFSVLVAGKMFEKLLIQSQVIREFRMLKLWRNINVNWVSKMPAAGVISFLLVVAGIVVFAARFRDSLGMDFKGGVRVIFNLRDQRPIEHVRAKLDSIKGPDGRPLYNDIEVTAMSSEAGTGATKIQILAKTVSTSFQVRTSNQDLDQLKMRIQEVFAGEIAHEPYDEPVFEEDASVKFVVSEGDKHEQVSAGGWFVVYFKQPTYDRAAVEKKLEELGKQAGLSVDTETTPKVNVRWEEAKESPAGLVKGRVLFAKPDMKREGAKHPEKFTSFLKKFVKAVDDGDLKLSENPFVAPGRMGPTAAADLQYSTIWALGVAWIAIIIYVAIRFASWKFGVAAVVGLVFDIAVSIGFVALCGWIVPKSWGLSFEMNVTTLAAVLTVIGYSVNDTVVLFDRVRENLVLMKKDSFRDIINTSVNQTMSRTILTGVSVLGTCVILYVFTMTSAGGVAEFALPMFVGVLAGTFASIFIGCSIALALSGGQKPAIAR